MSAIADAWIDLLARRADDPDRIALQFLTEGEVDGPVETLTNGALCRDARAIAAALTDAGAHGERALLLYPPGLDFVRGFFGCLLGGVVAVPTYPPDPSRLERTLPRLRAVVRDSGARFVLTTSAVGQLAEVLFADVPELSSLQWIATDAVDTDAAQRWSAPDVSGDTVAFLQYTSGSTGAPRGVVVTHRNLLVNSAEIHRLAGHSPASVYVCWVPSYHDMGLIGGILQPIYGGFRGVLLSPLAFLQRPMRWLEAISRHRGTTSPFPNFALDLCARKATPAAVAALDLRSWRVACNGAEPVRWESLARFTEVFGPAGFSPSAHYPAYGLAEATLIVSGRAPGAVLRTLAVDPDALGEDRIVPRQGGRTLVGCGVALEGHAIAVADPLTATRLGDRRVGEIRVRGPSVAKGYWGRPDDTRDTFEAPLDGEDPWLRTGDLGFLDDGELYVTGRLKDLLIMRGRNHYPQDIERTVEGCHAAVRAGCAAAFAAEADGEERLVVAAEVAAGAGDHASIVRAIHAALAEDHELAPLAVLLLPPGALPKTSSGKLQRRACAAAWRASTLDVLHRWDAPAAPRVESATPVPSSPGATESAARADAVIAWLRAYAEESIDSRLIDERRSIPPSIVLDFASRGLFGFQAPRSLGGLELSHRDTMRLVEQLAAIDLTLATFVGSHNDLGLQPILRHGTPTLKASVLERLSSGRELAAFALTEPGAGSNVLGIATRAVPAEGGSRLYGTKLWSGSAAWAGAIIVFARHLAADGVEAGVSAFVVRRGAPGLRMGPEALTMGLRGMVQGIFHLDAVQVGPDAMLGGPGQGLAIAQEAMSLGRMGIAAMSVGAMKRCAQLFCRYASRRRIGTGLHLDNPVTAQRLGELTLRIRATEALLEACVAPLDAGEHVPSEMLSLAKVAGSEFLWQSADALVQALGGRGYMEPNEAPQLLRDARVMRVGEGPTETLQMHVGASLLAPESALLQYVAERFGAEVAGRLDAAGAALVSHATRRLAEPVSARRFAAARLGELATDALVWAALRHHAPPGATTDRAEAWAARRFDQAEARALSGSADDVAGVDDAAILAALVADYAQAIGDLDRVAAGEDRERDPLLRRAYTPAPEAAAPEPAQGPEDQALVAFLRERLAGLLRLPLDQVPIDRPFTELGLDSVVAVELAHAAEARLGRPVDPSLAWNHPTLAAMTRHLATVAPASGARLVVEPTPPGPRSPLSFMERQLYALIARSPWQEPYNLFVPLRLRGPIDPTLLEQSFQALLHRHENLRAAFVLEGGEPVRHVVDEVQWSLTVADLRACSGAARADAVTTACDEVRHTTFDLARPPLLHARLLLLEADETVLIASVSHLAVDAWSLGIFFGELGALYAAALRGDATPGAALPPLSLRYADYAVSVAAAAAELTTHPELFPPWPEGGFRLSLDAPRPALPAPEGARTAFVLVGDAHDRLLALCRARGLSPAIAVLAAWQVALHRHTRRPDVAFTLVQGNRRIPGLRGVVGLFVYGETYRGDLGGAPTWLELLSRARHFVQEERPLAAQLYNSVVQPPSIRVSLNIHNFEAATGEDAGILVPAHELNPYAYMWETHDVMLNVVPQPRALVFDLMYRREVLQSATAEGLVRELQRALDEMVEAPAEAAVTLA